MAPFPRRRSGDLTGAGVRRARNADRAAILALWSELIAAHPSLAERVAPGREAAALARALDAELSDPQCIVQVADPAENTGAKEDGVLELDGFCIARWHPVPAGLRGAPRASLDELYVRPPQRRRGVGRRLVAGVFAALARAGVGPIEVRVHRDNEGARAFWRAQGFRPRVEILERDLGEL